MVKTRTDCSCRGPQFTDADHVTATYNSSFFWPPWTPHTGAIHLYRQVHIGKNKNKSLFYKSQNVIGLL